MEVSGAAAIVTGGASGLGAATVRSLAAAGAAVLIVDLQQDLGEQLASEVGGAAAFAAADVTSAADVQRAVEVARAMGPLRVVVNCAGVAAVQRTLSRDGAPASVDNFRRVVDINLVGTYNVITHAAAAMAEASPLADGERGVIVNTASIAAYEGQIGQAPYSASKGGIVGMTLPIARDLAVIGVRVNTIAPGIVDTPLLGSLGEEVRQSLAADLPFPKRLGTPEDFAQLVMAIITIGYLNGEVIRLDAALRMQPK